MEATAFYMTKDADYLVDVHFYTRQQSASSLDTVITPIRISESAFRDVFRRFNPPDLVLVMF